MAEYLIQQETLVDIANSIREKTGTTDTIVAANMAASIRSIITNGGVSAPVETTMVSQEVTVEENTNTFVTLLSENSFALEHRTDDNLFVLFTPVSVNSLNNSSFSGYQWVSMFAGNKELSMIDGYTWYGCGIYLMSGKSYSYPSSMEIPYPLTESSTSNYSYINIDENGNVRLYICSYDIIASGTYNVTLCLL